MTQLAIDGGEPLVRDLPDEIWPIVTDEDLAEVVRVLRSNRVNWSCPEEVRALEEDWAAFVGTQYATGFSTGTGALHGAVAAAGVGPGDEVLVPAFTFLASATPIIHHQGIPVFVDVDPVTFNIAPALIEERITDRTKAIMVVHFHGLPADMDEILAIARRHDLVVIEDCAQAQAAEYKGRRVGGIGDMSGTSIMAGKNLPTAGEGGLFATNDEQYREDADKVQIFGEIVRRGVPREFNTETMGWNYRMSNVMAAFARSQLKRLPELMDGFQRRVGAFSARLAELPGIIPPQVPADRTHVYHLYRFLVDPQAAGLDIEPGRFRKTLQLAFEAEGLPLKQYQNRPIPGQRLFQEKVGYGKGCPWTCGHTSARTAATTYDPTEYPNTLDVIERSLVVGGRFLLALGTLNDNARAALYLRCFEKVYDNLDSIEEHARALDYQHPWEEKLAFF
jgi:dTDP-4-amino-4,6-dideoxygalactose transaminase